MCIRDRLKEEMLRTKFEHLGNSGAVRKTMDRRMRKNTQRERKSLDAALGGGARTDIGRGAPARLAGERGGPPPVSVGVVGS